MHFAASCYVGESVTDPAKYYDNNLVGTMRLLQGMREAGVSQFIFSSSCATYGDPIRLPLDETHPLNPVNPYGYTKRAVEAMLSDYSRAYNLRYVSFRYFNAAGADPEGKLGECHDPETHLIPLILQVASGRRASVSIFGTDYETRDGTCIRDYIHIDDIAAAHLKGLDYLATGGESNVFNIGSETGYTVREVIEATERVTGKTITVEEGPRRPGDPPSLVASSAKIRDTLGWRPSYATLDDIIQTAWAWEQKEAARHT
jgi:UDP-glucose 4-epimerase